MHDDVRQLPLMIEEPVPDHHQVLWSLVSDGTGRIDSCVNISEAIVDDDRQGILQRLQMMWMVGAKHPCGIPDVANGQEAIGLHRLVTADPHQPSPEPLLVNPVGGHEVQEIGVVVAPDQP